MTRLILTTGIAVLAATGLGPQLAGAQTPRPQMARPAPEPREPPGQRIVPPGPPSLAVSVGFGRVEFDVNQRLAYAKSTQVPLTVKFTGVGTVLALGLGPSALPLGSHTGSFEQTVPNMDLRSLLGSNEAAILERCNAILGDSGVKAAESAFDAVIGFTAIGPGGATVASTSVPYQLGLTCTRIPPLTVTVGGSTVEYDINQPFAHAKGAQVPVTVKFNGPASVASLQFGKLSLPLGTHVGSFEQIVTGVDIRSLMNQEAGAILERCKSVLDYNKVESAAAAYDARLAFTVNAPSGAVVASTTVPYQLGLTCKRIPPLTVSIGYAKIEFSVAQPLATARGGQVPVTVKFNGAGNVASLQVGTVSAPLGAHSGSFEQTIPNVDVRALLNQEEAAIRSLCQSVLDANNVAAKETVYDARLPMTVNGPDGAVVASTTVPYQLGLTCKR